MRVEIRQSLARIALTTSITALALSFLNLSIPPSNMPFYLGAMAMSLAALVLGFGKLRAGGIALAFLLLVLAGVEWWRGEQEHANLVRFWKHQASLQQATNRPPANTPPQ